MEIAHLLSHENLSDVELHILRCALVTLSTTIVSEMHDRAFSIGLRQSRLTLKTIRQQSWLYESFND